MHVCGRQLPVPDGLADRPLAALVLIAGRTLTQRSPAILCSTRAERKPKGGRTLRCSCSSGRLSSLQYTMRVLQGNESASREQAVAARGTVSAIKAKPHALAASLRQRTPCMTPVAEPPSTTRDVVAARYSAPSGDGRFVRKLCQWRTYVSTSSWSMAGQGSPAMAVAKRAARVRARAGCMFLSWPTSGSAGVA